MSDADQNPVSRKKGFMGLTMHMTAGRWLMVGVGGVSLLTAFGVIWLEGRNASVDEGAHVNMQVSGGVRNTPGSSSPAYAKEVAAYNKKKANEALEHNQSFIGVPVTSVTSVQIPQETIQQPQTTVPAPIQEQPPRQQQQPQSMPADSAISKEIGVIATAMKNERAVNPGYYIPQYQAVSPALVEASASTATAASSATPTDLPAIRPGTIVYGVFENSMKSTMPGPVIGELVQGKYNGDRVIGSFSKSSGSDALLIRLRTLVLPDGKAISIDGYAVSPRTTLPGMATNVDYHVLSRTASFLGAAFLAGVEGYGSAVAQQGTTTVGSVFGGATTTYPMLTPGQTLDIAAGKAAEQLQPLQQNLAHNVMEPNTVTVAQGTPFALLVVSSGTVAAQGASQKTPSASRPVPTQAQPQTAPVGAGRALTGNAAFPAMNGQ